MNQSPPKPINAFFKRAKRLSQLYDFTMHSYSIISASLKDQIQAGTLGKTKHINSKHGFVAHHHIQSTLQLTEHNFAPQLRAVVLVRLISDFEVFLVSQIRYVATHGGLIFREDDIIKWPRGKFRSFAEFSDIRDHLLETDCRMLTSGGFDEIVKFYKKELGIQVNPPSISLDLLREIHVRRHLHVHRGGKADSTYIKDFNASVRLNQALPVEDDYLLRALEALRATASHVNSESEKRYPIKPPQYIVGSAHPSSTQCHFYLITARFADATKAKDYFKIDRPIVPGVTDVLADILLRAHVEGTRAEWYVILPTTYAALYFKDLALRNKSGELLSMFSDRLSPSPIVIVPKPTQSE